jgi:ppGpp synthetase/RelA/SpoT-type nucleotidyltranferase
MKAVKPKKTKGDSIAGFVHNYERIRPIQQQFTDRLTELLRALLAQSNIRFHTVESRTKEVSSFAEKIKRPGKSYTDPLNEITDLSGIRIIVYYSEDVTRVSKLIEKEFNVDRRASVDKVEELAPHEFGYLSVHYVMSLNKERKALTEWNLMKDLKAEVQVRTVLQHAWAAISHALQYKHEQEVPKHLARQLFRLSGLLELADEEFSSLQRKHLEFASAVATSSRKKTLGLTIDRVSLTEYLERSPIPRKLGRAAKTAGFKFEEFSIDEHDFAAGIAWACEVASIKTIAQLDKALKQKMPMHKQYLSLLKGEGRPDWYVSPPFLILLLLILARRECFTPGALSKHGWDIDIAKHVLESAKKAESKALP